MRWAAWALIATTLLTACLGAQVESVEPTSNPAAAGAAAATVVASTPATTLITTNAAVAAPTTTPPSAGAAAPIPPNVTSELPSQQAPARGRLVVHATGDFNVDPNYIREFRSEGYEYAFSGLDGLFTRDSLTIINLECPVSDRGSPVSKQFTFRCDPAALDAMVSGGVDVANQGNNHSLDFGVDALLDSIERLRRSGIAPVGAGRNAAEAAAPALFDIDGWTVAVIGFGGVVPAASWIATDERPGMADGDTIQTMVEAVAAADELADLVFVTIHWGVELDTRPRADDVARAEAMIAAGADAIFGHHSHRLNPMTFVDGKPVAWGLGNFVWPRLSTAGATTAVARVVVERSGSISACLLPAEIERGGHPVLQGPVPAGCPPAG